MFFSAILFVTIFLAQGSRDIAPPIDYSLVPSWVIFAAAFIGLTLLGLIGWSILRKRPAPSSPFSADERSLLEDFLNRCDLIKFARYNATVADSRLLLEEAMRFVKGGELATA